MTSRWCCVAWAALLVGCGGASAVGPEPEHELTEPAEDSQSAPEPDVAASPKTAETSDVDNGSTLTIESLTVDGVTLEHVECRVDGLGLLGTLVIAQVFSARRAELSRCMPAGAPVKVQWSFDANRVTKASAEGDAAASQCVSTALVGGPAPGNGACSGVVKLPR